MKCNVVWKNNNQAELSLLPPSYHNLVPENHSVRIIKNILVRIDIRSIENTYKGSGTIIPSAIFVQGKLKGSSKNSLTRLSYCWQNRATGA